MEMMVEFRNKFTYHISDYLLPIANSFFYIIVNFFLKRNVQIYCSCITINNMEKCFNLIYSRRARYFIAVFDLPARSPLECLPTPIFLPALVKGRLDKNVMSFAIPLKVQHLRWNQLISLLLNYDGIVLYGRFNCSRKQSLCAGYRLSERLQYVILKVSHNRDQQVNPCRVPPSPPVACTVISKKIIIQTWSFGAIAALAMCHVRIHRVRVRLNWKRVEN